MARKTLKDMSGIADAIARSAAKPSITTVKSSAPALGALQGSLAAIREIEADLIDDWGPPDRLDRFTAVNSDEESDGFDGLKDSIRENGQQVPILVRRAKVDGRFEAIYGRRRLRACRELGLKVRANVQDVDDQTALLAKGLENAARRNLSFYEKARFAEAIHLAGHDTKTVRSVLSLSASGLSHLTKVTQLVPSKLGDMIGPAPKAGRPKWTVLAEQFQSKRLTEALGLKLLSGMEGASSDERLDHLIAAGNRRGAKSRQASVSVPVEGVTIRSSSTTVSLAVKRSGKNAAFGDWLHENLTQIVEDSYAAFTAVNARNDKNNEQKKE